MVNNSLQQERIRNNIIPLYETDHKTADYEANDANNTQNQKDGGLETFVRTKHETNFDEPIEIQSSRGNFWTPSKRTYEQRLVDVYERIREYKTDCLLGETPKQGDGILLRIKPEKRLSEVKMTLGAYRRARKISKAICKEGKSLEVAMHLLRKREDPDDTITDVLPACMQVVSQNHCDFATWSYFSYPNHEYMGWCHSHGAHPTFHSAIDDENMKSKLVREGIHIPHTTITYLPSIVVNERGDKPYCALAISYEKNNRRVTSIKEVPLKIVSGKNLDFFDIDAFLKKHVQIQEARVRRRWE